MNGSYFCVYIVLLELIDESKRWKRDHGYRLLGLCEFVQQELNYDSGFTCSSSTLDDRALNCLRGKNGLELAVS